MACPQNHPRRQLGRDFRGHGTPTHPGSRPQPFLRPVEGIAQNSLFDSYILSLSHQLHEEEQYREHNDGRVDIQGFNLDSYGAWAQFEKSAGNSEVVYGASYYQNQVNSFRDNWNADGTFNSSNIQGRSGMTAPTTSPEFFSIHKPH